MNAFEFIMPGKIVFGADDFRNDVEAIGILYNEFLK